MDLKLLKYGYYQHYDSGDGSMYDHCTAYSTATKHYTVFSEDNENYYNILDNNTPYSKSAKYGETIVTISDALLDILPSCIDVDKDYNINDITALLPRKIVARLNNDKSIQMKKVL